MTSRQPHLAWTFLVAFSAVSSACNSGQIGGEVNGPDNGGLDNTGTETSGGCKDVASTPLAPDEVTSLGFDGATLLERITGEHSARAVWQVSESSLRPGVQLTPPAGETSITVTITPDASTLRLVERDVAQSQTEGNTLLDIGTAGGCGDQVRVDAQVRVVTDNGAFNDTFDATFTASSAHRVGASIPVAPGELTGSFDVAVDDPSSEAVQTTLGLGLVHDALSGSLSGVIETRTDEAVSAGFVTYATFPPESCESGLWIDPQSELAVAAKAALDGLEAFDLTWDSGGTAQLEMAHEVSRFCLQDEAFSEDETVVMAVQSTVTSTDGRIDGSWALEGQLKLAPDGSLKELMLLRQAYMVDGFAPNEFEASTGIAGVTIADGSRGSFMFDVSRSFDGTAEASGSLTILELTTADCSNQKPVEVEDGASSPGCAGSTSAELESATLTEREAAAATSP